MLIKKLHFCIFFILLAVSFSFSLTAAESTGAAFLKLGIGARPLAIGKGFTAIADDVSAMYWNPGGLAQLKSREIQAMYVNWIDDIRYEFVGFANPIQTGTLGIGIVYLHMGEIERRGENRELLEGTFTASDLALTMSYSREITKLTNAGINIKGINQKIENEKAYGIAIDLGLLQKTAIKDLQLGLSLQNLGPKMSFITGSFNLPLTVNGAVSYKLFSSPFAVAMNIGHEVYSSKTDVAIGTEFWFGNRVALRGKYLFLNENKVESLSNIGLGAGIKISRFGIDYSFGDYKELGNTHRLSFSGKFK